MNRVERGRWKLVSSDVDRAEAIARRDEDRGFAGEGGDEPVRVGRALQQPQARRADGDDPAAGRARRDSARRGRRVDAAPFRMHRVIARVLDLDRQEGAGADMQREPMQRDAARLDRARRARA